MKKIFILFLFLSIVPFTSNAKTVSINIDSVPSDAKLTVNGNYMGQTPVSGIGVEENERFKIKLEHDEAYTTEQTREISSSDNPNIVINLDLKTSFISFKYVPSGYDVSVNGLGIGTTPLNKYKVHSGTNDVKFSSSANNSSFTQSINVSGGQTYEFSPDIFVVGKRDSQTAVAVPVQDTQEKSAEAAKKSTSNDKQLFLSFGFGATGATFKEDKVLEDYKKKNDPDYNSSELTYSGGLDIGLEYRFRSGIFMGVEYNYDFNTFDPSFYMLKTEKSYIDSRYKQDTIYCMPSLPNQCSSSQMGPYTQPKNNATTRTTIYEPTLENYQTVTANLGFTLFKFLSFYGRGGVAIVRLKYENGYDTEDAKTLYAPAYGGGVRVNFTKNFSLDAAYLYSKFDVEGFDETINQYKLYLKFFF